VRDNIEAAKSVGVDAVRMKWFVFLVSPSAPASPAADLRAEGADLTGRRFLVTDWTAYVIFIVVIGGIGTIEGPIIGVLMFFILQSLLADYGSWYLITLGIIGIVIMLFAPRGLWGLISDRPAFELFPGSPAPDRWTPRQLAQRSDQTMRRNRPWLIFKPTF
jgi:branched-chain amino acid transport system permease protein